MSMEALEMMVKHAKNLLFCRPAKSGEVYVTLTSKQLPRDPATLNHTRKTGPEGASAVPNLVYLPPGKERSSS